MGSKSYNLSHIDSGNEPVIPTIPVINTPNSVEVVSYEDALKLIGFGKVQIQLICIGSLLLFTVLNESMGISFLLTSAQCDLNMGTSEKGLLSGMGFFGIMVSSYFAGFIGDTKGRRFLMLYSVLCSTCCTIISAFMNNYISFLILRFFVGFFVGGFSAPIYPYVGEFMVNKHRGTSIAVVSISIGTASLYLPAIGMWILSYDWSFELFSGYYFKPWRLLLFIYTFPGIIAGVWLFTMRESPRYLLSQGRDDEALKVVRWIYKVNKGKRDIDDFKIMKLLPEKIIGDDDKKTGFKSFMILLKNQTLPLLLPPHIKYFAACCFMHFGTFCVAGGHGLFLPTTLNRVSNSLAEGNGDLRICEVIRMDSVNQSAVVETVCNDTVNLKSLMDSIWLGVVYTISLIVISFAMQIIGRRIIFVVTLLVSGASGIALVFVVQNYLMILFYCLFVAFAGINVSTINGAAVDLFPTHLRAMAVCVSMMMGRLGSALSSLVIGNIIETNCEVTYYVFAGIIFICFGVSFILRK